LTHQNKGVYLLYSMKNNIILVDVDDVLANLVEEWLHVYNELANDNITPNIVTDWDISNFVKPDWKSKIYEILESHDLYNKVAPVKGALDGVKRLIAGGYRVVYVTAPIIETAGSKYFWLQKNGFPVTLENYIEAKDKSLIFGHFMIDDGIHNIENTLASDQLLFTKPWNKDCEGYNRVNNWKEIMEWFGT